MSLVELLITGALIAIAVIALWVVAVAFFVDRPAPQDPDAATVAAAGRPPVGFRASADDYRAAVDRAIIATAQEDPAERSARKVETIVRDLAFDRGVTYAEAQAMVDPYLP